MTTPAELRDAITMTHARFKEAIAGLDDAVLEDEPALGVWPVREIAGHLAAWNDVIIDAIEDTLDGVPLRHEPVTDHDGFNALAAADSARHSWQAVSNRLDATIARATMVVDCIGSDQMGQPAPFPWGWAGTLEQLVHGIDGHTGEHIEELQPWLEGR